MKINLWTFSSLSAVTLFHFAFGIAIQTRAIKKKVSRLKLMGKHFFSRPVSLFKQENFVCENMEKIISSSHATIQQFLKGNSVNKRAW
jgi:hypothetical protein